MKPSTSALAALFPSSSTTSLDGKRLSLSQRLMAKSGASTGDDGSDGVKLVSKWRPPMLATPVPSNVGAPTMPCVKAVKTDVGTDNSLPSVTSANGSGDGAYPHVRPGALSRPPVIATPSPVRGCGESHGDTGEKRADSQPRADGVSGAVGKVEARTSIPAGEAGGSVSALGSVDPLSFMGPAQRAKTFFEVVGAVLGSDVTILKRILKTFKNSTGSGATVSERCLRQFVVEIGELFKARQDHPDCELRILHVTEFLPTK